MHGIWMAGALVVAAWGAAGPETPGPVRADAPPAGDATAPGADAKPPAAESTRSQEERRKLEEDIARELGATPPKASGAPGSVPSPPVPPPPLQPGGEGSQGGAQAAPQGQTGGNPLARLLLIPDISAIGSFALAWNQLDVEGLSPRSDPFAPAHKVKPIFQELELGLQAVVDPYARADVFLTFSPSGAAVEEAYVTTLTLPAGLQVRAGEIYAPVGRQNQQHPHVWDFVDRPLALARLVGVDGLRGPGVDVAWLAPTPWYAELHLAYQSLAPGFQARESDAGLARLVQFFDVGDASTLGVGISGALLDEPGAGAWRGVLGTDVYLKYRPARSRSYLAVQGELLARKLAVGDRAPDLATPFEQPGTAWGGYVQAVWRDGPFLAYGVRYERAPGVAGGPEQRAAALASYLPSEFSRLRLQVSLDRLPGGSTGFEALLHAEFAIGVHGAHPF